MCKVALFDEGESSPKLRCGKVVQRQVVWPLQCGDCPKIPIGRLPVPSNAEPLSPKNRQAYEHYQECRAVGMFPDDWIVRRNARLIRKVEDMVAAERSVAPLRDFVRSLAVLTRRGR